MTHDDIVKLARQVRDGGHWNQLDLINFARLVAAAEREACANVCEETTASWTQPVYNGACMDCAVAIRARGEK